MAEYLRDNKLTPAGVHLARTLESHGCDKKVCLGCPLSNGKGSPGDHCPAGASGVTNRQDVDKLLEIYNTMP